MSKMLILPVIDLLSSVLARVPGELLGKRGRAGGADRAFLVLLLVLGFVSTSEAKDRCGSDQVRIFTGDCVSKCGEGEAAIIAGGCARIPQLLHDEPGVTEQEVPDHRTAAEQRNDSEDFPTGKVVVHFILEADGRVGRIEARTPNPGLREDLIRRVRSRKYEPAIFDGKPVAVYMTSTYQF